MKYRVTLFAIFIFFESLAQNNQVDWSKYQQHEIPEWFEDSKLGIYAHLGVYSVPAYANEWYTRNMYLLDKDGKPSKVMQHHLQNYGPLTKFGYKDFIPMFKAEKFDAAAWSELFKKAGAKFAGVVTEHHDGFAMWDSKINPFNAVDMGPHKNIYGDMVRELRKRDMKILATFHHAFSYNYFYPNQKNNDLDDPKFKYLYGRIDKEEGNKRWYGQIKEVIDQYQPDQIWFDFDLKFVPDAWRFKFTDYYYSKAKEWNKPVIITRKQEQLPVGIGVLDIERGNKEKPADTLFQTDDALAINSWTWVQDLKLKPASEIIHELIDIVSKNGVLLLNVCPKADGSIPDDQQKVLLELGHFLDINGNAIYSTRPFKIHGEGPRTFDSGRGLNKMAREATLFNAEDIRFTQSKDGKKIYVIAMGWPTYELRVKSVLNQIIEPNKIASIKLLGKEDRLVNWTAENGYLLIRTANEEVPKDQYAYAWEINLL